MNRWYDLLTSEDWAPFVEKVTEDRQNFLEALFAAARASSDAAVRGVMYKVDELDRMMLMIRDEAKVRDDA